MIGLLTLAAPAAGRPAPAAGSYSTDGFGWDGSVYGSFSVDYHGAGFGAGIQLAYPLIPNGFFQGGDVRDALQLEGGLEFSHWSWENAGRDARLLLFVPDVGLRYTIYLTDRVAPFVTLKAGVAIPEASGLDAPTTFYWCATGGLLFDLSEAASLRAEFGWGRYRDAIRLGVLLRF